jgi:hypothetical protein
MFRQVLVFFAVFTFALSFTESVFASQSSLTDSILVTARVPLNLAPSFPDVSSTNDINSGVQLDVSYALRSIIFKGYAHPLSVISLLHNGVIVGSSTALPDGSFTISMSGLSTGNYNFSLIATDSFGLKTSLFPISVFVPRNEEITVSNILLSSTISSNFSTVNFGSTLHFYGSALPGAVILAAFDEGLFYKATTSGDGVWSLDIDSRVFRIGANHGDTFQYIKNDSSLKSDVLDFRVGHESVLRSTSTSLHSDVITACDLNSDGLVNLRDFSIMSYWYNRKPFPNKVDLNQDKDLTLFDFSILAYCWTG